MAGRNFTWRSRFAGSSAEPSRNATDEIECNALPPPKSSATRCRTGKQVHLRISAASHTREFGPNPCQEEKSRIFARNGVCGISTPNDAINGENIRKKRLFRLQFELLPIGVIAISR